MVIANQTKVIAKEIDYFQHWIENCAMLNQRVNKENKIHLIALHRVIYLFYM